MRLICPCPFGYGAQSGYYTDPETGLMLTTYRYYDPTEGRFLNRDPIGYAGGMNQYAYCGGNPVNWLDPLGLRPYALGDGYWYTVGQVFVGYGHTAAGFLPWNMYQDIVTASQWLGDVAGRKGDYAALCLFARSIANSFDFLGTSDPEEFGSRFLNVELIAAARVAPYAELGVIGNIKFPKLLWKGGELVIGDAEGVERLRGNFLGDRGSSNPLGRRPHYHRRIIDPKTGKTVKGGGRGKHRPWEKTDKKHPRW